MVCDSLGLRRDCLQHDYETGSVGTSSGSRGLGSIRHKYDKIRNCTSGALLSDMHDLEQAIGIDPSPSSIVLDCGCDCAQLLVHLTLRLKCVGVGIEAVSSRASAATLLARHAMSRYPYSRFCIKHGDFTLPEFGPVWLAARVIILNDLVMDQNMVQVFLDDVTSASPQLEVLIKTTEITQSHTKDFLTKSGLSRCRYLGLTHYKTCLSIADTWRLASIWIATSGSTFTML